ncbi:MAG: hypothetical protein IPQ06_01030 [Chitinophagaceae bacterium]|nr:hypothetical protein [Chitinophagaceae bacterium]MBL0271672.1 hypothetical protein [Chitinophagaceae bacterium]
MIATNKYLILPGFFLGFWLSASGQVTFASNSANNDQKCKPPKNRELFHDYIDAQQKLILKSDGKNDNQYTPSDNEEVNFQLTRTLINRVDDLQCKIEADTLLKDQGKVKYLRGVEYLLKFFNQNTSSKKINPVILPDIISAYEKCVALDKEGKSIENIVSPLSYETAYSLIKADNATFEKNSGYRGGLQGIVLKYCILHPERTLSILRDNPDMPFADSLVRTVAQKYPRQLYDFAAANNKLGYVIRNITDDIFIKTIVKMARSKNGQQYFPFLDNIVKGKMSFEEVDEAKDDSLLYYKLLIKTQLEYVARALNKDTAFEYKSLRDRVEVKARENFVNIINGLHTESAELRFRSIQPLSAEELYYLAVSADGSIYTSSFVKGVYPLMMKKINNKGDSLLVSLHFDKYRKFIKMTAGFNMLSNFLGTFPPKRTTDDESDAEKLMKAFVGKLEKGSGLEDGVEVADSYASVVETIKPLAHEMLKNIRLNYQQNEKSGNKRGLAIYKILTNLFLSADSTNNIDLTKELGIPPVYEIPFKALANDSGTVIIQVFIFGDKDGIGVFPGILSLFNTANWKTDKSNPQWVTVSSLKGKPVSIYFNRPLPEEKNEDAKAQEALCKYLDSSKLYPTVTINRGHSYNATYTIEQMFPTSKIVFMGSCGGYRAIHDILEKAPDAHIVGTKQIADVPVNNPFLKLLAEKLRSGSNIEWIPFWKELDDMVTNEIFDDYVPPYKNLGALFIKAYKIAMGE